MYKHDCVKCSRIHNHRCVLGISFFNRFFGTKEVIECFNYKAIIKYQKFKNRKGKRN